ncbi:MAG: hypothetical protein WCH05_01850 [Chlorobiaceae bacterium]
MERNVPTEAAPEKRSLKKGSGLFFSITGFLTLCFFAVVIWINWPKARIQPEPLSPALKTVVDRIPERSDALIYIGFKDIRESRFWKEIIPDSLKKAPLFEEKGKLAQLMKAAAINPVEDVDTLLVSFRQHGYRQQQFICVAWGPFSKTLPESFLKTHSRSRETIGGRTCYALDSTLWICPTGPRQIAMSSSRTMLQEFLEPHGSFFRRDSLSTSLIDKAVYKSHLWFALPSAAWTTSALQSLTSSNRDMKTLGNLNRIQHLALSMKFNDGIEGESEWVYKTRRAAYFASTFLWGAVRISEFSNSRTSDQAKQLLKNLEIQQNMESVIVHTRLPLELFQQARQTKNLK